VRGVNLVLLISMILYVSLGLVLQNYSLIWGTIGTEVLYSATCAAVPVNRQVAIAPNVAITLAGLEYGCLTLF